MGFIVGVDLGQKRDYSAMVIVERPLWANGLWVYQSDMTRKEADDAARIYGERGDREDWTARVLHVERWPLGMTYPRIIDDVARMVETITNGNSSTRVSLIVDSTGVGNAVVDMIDNGHGEMLADRGVDFKALTITGGVSDNWVASSQRDIPAPKRDIVFSAVTLLEAGRLQWPSDDQNVKVLEDELRNFEMKYSKAGNEMFEAARQEHDDLVLALGMATWYAQHQMGGAARSIFL